LREDEHPMNPFRSAYRRVRCLALSAIAIGASIAAPAGAQTSVPAAGAIAGYYADANGRYHGFVRDPQGAIASFDPPGSLPT
jgi:hypothetical protein